MTTHDIPELVEIISKYGSPEQWCVFLNISRGTCNGLDKDWKHRDNVILTVAQQYVDEIVTASWEDIVRVLCQNLKKINPALKLSEKHGVDFSSQCAL